MCQTADLSRKSSASCPMVAGIDSSSPQLQFEFPVVYHLVLSSCVETETVLSSSSTHIIFPIVLSCVQFPLSLSLCIKAQSVICRCTGLHFPVMFVLGLVSCSPQIFLHVRLSFFWTVTLDLIKRYTLSFHITCSCFILHYWSTTTHLDDKMIGGKTINPKLRRNTELQNSRNNQGSHMACTERSHNELRQTESSWGNREKWIQESRETPLKLITRKSE